MRSFRFLGIVLFIVSISISSCINEEDNIGRIQADVYSRSCLTVTQAWIEELRNLASEEFSTPSIDLQISAIERVSDSTFIYHTPSELSGKQPIEISGFLLLVTDGDFEGNIFGYFDPTNLSFCTSPEEQYFLVDDIGTLVQTTLGILGVDSDSF